MCTGRCSRPHSVRTWRKTRSWKVLYSEAEGTPPERYQLEYRIRGLRQTADDLSVVKSHMVEIALPLNYPRLNEWPEWFVVEPGRQYRVDDSGGDASGAYDGARLGNGLDLRLQGGAERRLRVCTA